MRFPMQTLKPLGDQGALEADPAPKRWFDLCLSTGEIIFPWFGETM